MFQWCLEAQGSPYSNYFISYLIKNATFCEVRLFRQLPIELSIELPIELPSVLPGPGPAGSWAGPAWFKMLLGLGGNQGGGEGGGKGVISCT